MMMTTAGLSSRGVTSSEDIYTLICHDFLKNIFLFAHRLRQVMIVQDKGAMNYELQMSVQLTNLMMSS